MDQITEKQLRFLNILLTDAFNAYRKTYLKIYWNVESSKDLTKEMASVIIEQFLSDNPDREQKIAEAKEKIYESLGQKKLFA